MKLPQIIEEVYLNGIAKGEKRGEQSKINEIKKLLQIFDQDE